MTAGREVRQDKGYNMTEKNKTVRLSEKNNSLLEDIQELKGKTNRNQVIGHLIEEAGYEDPAVKVREIMEPLKEMVDGDESRKGKLSVIHAWTKQIIKRGEITEITTGSLKHILSEEAYDELQREMAEELGEELHEEDPTSGVLSEREREIINASPQE